MSAQIIDGKAFAAKVRGQVAEHVTRIKEENGITPGLAVVLVGEDPASQVYVRSKGKQTVEAGMNSYEHKLDADTSQDDLLKLIADLNADKDVHGILVQLPLPKHLNEDLVINSIAPAKRRGWVSYLKRGAFGDWAKIHGALYAAWMFDDVARLSWVLIWHECGCHWAFEYRWQTNGTIVVG